MEYEFDDVLCFCAQCSLKGALIAVQFFPAHLLTVFSWIAFCTNVPVLLWNAAWLDAIAGVLCRSLKE